MARRESLCLITLLELFLEELYKGEWIRIRKYLSILVKLKDWMDQKFKEIQRNTYSKFKEIQRTLWNLNKICKNEEKTLVEEHV